LKLLIDRREELIMRRGGVVNRLLWLATQLGLVAGPARDELADIIQFTDAIDESGNRIGRPVRLAAP
jgi:hypothetical protein